MRKPVDPNAQRILRDGEDPWYQERGMPIILERVQNERFKLSTVFLHTCYLLVKIGAKIKHLAIFTWKVY